MRDDRQDSLHVLYKLTRRSPLSFTMHRGHEAVELVHKSQYKCCSLLPPRVPEYDDGYTEQIIFSGPGMVNEQQSPTTHISMMGLPSHRCIHNITKSKMPPLFLESRDGTPITGGCLPNHLGQITLYAFPPILLPSQVIHKIHVNIAKVILIALTWPRQNWYPYLMHMVVCAA